MTRLHYSPSLAVGQQQRASVTRSNSVLALSPSSHSPASLLQHRHVSLNRLSGLHSLSLLDLTTSTDSLDDDINNSRTSKRPSITGFDSNGKLVNGTIPNYLQPSHTLQPIASTSLIDLRQTGTTFKDHHRLNKSYGDHHRLANSDQHRISDNFVLLKPAPLHYGSLMSLREVSGRSGAPVSRSNSFGTASLTSSVLGEGVRKPRPHYAKPQRSQAGRRKSAKQPKVPRPARAIMVFESIKTGIGEFIQATHDDIAQLMQSETGTSTAQGRVHETDKQIKAAERYLKRLEFHLAKIDELHDCYMLHQQMREGARNMHRAYSASPQSRKDSLKDVKYGYKECSQTMCAIEAQLENMLGTFSCRLKGIAGFARLTPGDVFEVVIKHGAQKWKSKGRMEKNNTQRWDKPEFTFKCLVGETLSIKASEVRVLKTVLLGQKNCEVCHPSSQDSAHQGLFSANPQLMTVSVNVHGSLKLSIIITWNPLDGIDETVTFYEPLSRNPSSLRQRPVSVIGINGGTYDSSSDISISESRRRSSPLHMMALRDDSGIYGSATSLPSHMTQDLRYSSSLSGSPVTRRGPTFTPDLNGRLRPHSVVSPDVRSVRSQPSTTASTTSSGQGDGFQTRPHSTYMPTAMVVPSTSSSGSSSVFLSQGSSTGNVPEVTQAMIPGVQVQAGPMSQERGLSVEDAVGSLLTCMEDFLGQYLELQKLEEVVPLIEAFVRKRKSSDGSGSSSMSVSIEGAIEEAFDFLNTEDILDELDEEEEDESQPQENSANGDTAKTADSGIESLAKRLSEDTRLSSNGSSPEPPSSGNEQVDAALIFHLSYCEKLLENLGNYGPLKCREFYALDRIQKQAKILEDLVAIAKSGSEVNLEEVLTNQTSDPVIADIWRDCVEDGQLIVSAEKLISILDQRHGAKLFEHFEVKTKRIFFYLMSEILDVSSFTAESEKSSSVTVHQFTSYFTEQGGYSRMEKMAEELRLMDRLSSVSTDIVLKAILTLREEVPAPPCLKLLGKLLLSGNKEMQSSASSYLKIINRDKKTRDEAMVILVEGLEDHIAEVRAGCCTALSVIEAEESIEQLVHVCQSDASSTVRRKAKDALYSLGDVGRKAVEEAQLGSQGFQGLQVRKV